MQRHFHNCYLASLHDSFDKQQETGVKGRRNKIGWRGPRPDWDLSLFPVNALTKTNQLLFPQCQDFCSSIVPMYDCEGQAITVSSTAKVEEFYLHTFWIPVGHCMCDFLCHCCCFVIVLMIKYSVIVLLSTCRMYWNAHASSNIITLKLQLWNG